MSWDTQGLGAPHGGENSKCKGNNQSRHVVEIRSRDTAVAYILREQGKDNRWDRECHTDRQPQAMRLSEHSRSWHKNDDEE